MTLQTSANAAIPAGLRKRPALDAAALSGASKHAAGVLHIAPDGDILLLRRAGVPGQDNFVGHWALPGGGVESGETPQVGAARENKEEMGIDVDPAALKDFDQVLTPNGMAFHTFANPVQKKFWPTINDEHTGAGWFPLSDLPRPMHPAVESMLKQRLGMADDMKPEDWAGLRDGLLKWTAEEEREDEHVGATDTALKLALDRNTVRTTDQDGHLHVSETNVCKACVSPYRGEEIPGCEELGLDPDRVYQLLRPPEELEKAAASINGKPLLRLHKPTSAEDHQTELVAGAVGTNARWELPYIKNGLTIWNGKDIDGVESKQKYALSPGYRYRAVMEPGSYDGTPYDGKMVDIKFNHLCLVEDGRQGGDIVVGDSADELYWSQILEALQGYGT